MRKLFFILFLFPGLLHAQVTKVILQASGLTCSMCSNSINKALKTVSFVDKVEPNIKNSSFEITFKPGSKIDFDVLKKKVEDAGYAVADFKVAINFNSVAVAPESHVTVGDYTFHFLKTGNQTLNGVKTIRIIDKGFVSSKEYKKNSSLTTMGCYKTGEEKGLRVFHVTI